MDIVSRITPTGALGGAAASMRRTRSDPVARLAFLRAHFIALVWSGRRCDFAFDLARQI